MTTKTPRVALVTGGSRGIGAATCLALAEKGIDTAINFLGDRHEAEDVARQVRDKGCRAELFEADICKKHAAERLADEVLAAFGGVDTLVNNAGFGTSAVGIPLVTEMDVDHIDLLMRVHVYGPAVLCRKLVPQMRARSRGDVIMVSTATLQSYPARMGTYLIAKSGMEALAHTLAREEREHGIRVNIVAPGLTDTGMGASAIKKLFGHDNVREMDKDLPFGLMCTPSDIACTIAFLVSAEGRYVNDQCIRVDGGAF